MAKKMTIEDLAVIVKHGFDDMQQRFDQSATKEDFRQLEQRIETVKQKLDASFQHVNARLDRIRDDIADLPAIREELEDLRQRVERLNTPQDARCKGAR
jgi:Skp family chaperone for outer membrane proteins